MSYQDVKDRLYHGHRKIANNTYLELRQLDITTVEEGWTKEEFVDMRLHGNLIARFYPTHLQLFSVGWYTNTTRRRLNLALELANIGYSVYQVKHQWYYGSHRYIEFYDGIRIGYTGKVLS